MAGEGAAGDRIEIDAETLERASRDLVEAGGRIAGAAATAGGATVSAHAFGAMNSYLGTSIAGTARGTTDLLRTIGDVVNALGVAAQSAADDFAAYEAGVADSLAEAAADLAGQQAIL